MQWEKEVGDLQLTILRVGDGRYNWAAEAVGILYYLVGTWLREGSSPSVRTAKQAADAAVEEYHQEAPHDPS